MEYVDYGCPALVGGESLCIMYACTYGLCDFMGRSSRQNARPLIFSTERAGEKQSSSPTSGSCAWRLWNKQALQTRRVHKKVFVHHAGDPKGDMTCLFSSCDYRYLCVTLRRKRSLPYLLVCEWITGRGELNDSWRLFIRQTISVV